MANKKFEEAIVFYFSSNSHQLLFSDILFELQKLGNRKLTIYSALFPIDNEGNNLLSHDRFNDIELKYPGPVRKFYEIKSRLFRIKFSCTELFDYFFSEFKKIQPGCIVLGNDTGHIERSIIRAAKCLKIRTVLMQDGYIYNAIKSPFLLNCLNFGCNFSDD